MTALLALFNSSAFEAYFWLSPIPKTLTTSFGLAALIFLSRFRQTKASIFGGSYLVLVTLGMIMESTGLILPLLGLCLDTYYRPWRTSIEEKANLLSGLRLHFWAFSLLVIFLLIRHFLNIKSYVINIPITEKFQNISRTVVSTFYHKLTDIFNLSVTGNPLILSILTLGLCIVLVMAWYAKQKPDRSRFITLLLLWVGACLPHTIGANFQSRYLYFPGVFAALVLADMMGTLRLRLSSWKYRWLLISLVVIGYLATDLRAFHQSLNSYMEATRIYDAGIQKIISYLPEMKAGTRIVFIDFPDSIRRPRTFHQGQQEGYHILVYRNAFPAQLILLYPKFNFPITFVKLSPFHDNDDNPDPLGTLSSPDQLAKLLASPQTVAFRYCPGKAENFVMVPGSSKP